MEKIYPKILEKIPDTVDFSFISVRNMTQKSFFLENPSDQSIIYRIENENAYVFEPNQGVIMKKHKIEIKIKIVPESATVLIANALIVLDEKSQKIIKLSSIAKYPYIKINKSAMEFGNVLIGKSKEMELILTNSEKVPAKFSIVKKTIPFGKIKEYFYLSTTKGDIPPENSFLIKIKFITSHPGQFSYETFEVITNGGNTSRFSCFGNCLSLTTHISSKNVNFHSIELTSSMSKLIRLYNDSEEPTTFQIYHNNDGPFKILETEGVIGAKTNVRVNVIFKPNDTMTYYERVFCLIRNHNVLVF
jgi:hypothetical protein